ncbi:helix-turn-helix domain-containing protein [uncultured Tateyamaria sp.]|uniref:helix-turn-helix domain-containing protein n=1 Tax=uncultured Tateyamaria sp. TaxID=455651 RepID=UPI0026386A93|nr:helix-turn-helix domain-containing protein [uncultured Tateyamaria sp.]
MSDKNKSASGNIVQLRPSKAGRASEKKWGKQVMDLGFCIVPSLLLRAQQRLGLNPTQLAVLMQLCDFWWEDARKPHPGKKLLAERLGLSERQVQRYIAELEQAGLVERVERYAAHGGKMTNTYDLSGLVARLKKLEPEFRKVEENVKTERKAVAKRGYKPKRKPSATAN